MADDGLKDPTVYGTQPTGLKEPVTIPLVDLILGHENIPKRLGKIRLKKVKEGLEDRPSVPLHRFLTEQVIPKLEDHGFFFESKRRRRR